MSELPDGKVVLVDVSGKGRVLDINLDSIQESLKEWAAMYGEGGDQNERLGIRITDEANAKSGGAFEGEGIDGKSEGNIEGKDDAEGKGEGKGKERIWKRGGRREGEGNGKGKGNGDGEGEGTGNGNGRGGKGGGKVREKAVRCLMCFLVYLRSKP